MGPLRTRRRQRRHLHFDALIHLVRHRFETVPDPRRCPTFPLADTLTAGLALFSLKDPSLLAFCDRPTDHNLRSVFGLHAVPSDTQVREILDAVDPEQLRPVFTDVFRQVQRGKVLEEFVFLEGSYLVALDGVEYFCSEKVHCPHCLTRTHAGGGVSHYHQMLGAAIVHPDFGDVLPLAPEPIRRPDGAAKNDCERNAARRWRTGFRTDHPHLSIIVTGDALSSNAPHTRDLRAAGAHFILGVKAGDHAYLFDQFEQRPAADRVASVHADEDATGAGKCWMFTNGVSLDASSAEVGVNLSVYVEVEAGGAVRKWAWVTDLPLTAANVRDVARGGRARWRIENETFNTLKNQGYHFGHNFGHGEQHLAEVFAVLVVAAFLIDQVQRRSNPLFRRALETKGRRSALWDAVRHLFAAFGVSSMREMYEALAYGHERPRLKPLIEPVAVGAGREPSNTS